MNHHVAMRSTINRTAMSRAYASALLEEPSSSHDSFDVTADESIQAALHEGADLDRAMAVLAIAEDQYEKALRGQGDIHHARAHVMAARAKAASLLVAAA